MKDIVFRKINGRIVPIRKSGQNKTPGRGSSGKKVAAGAGLIASGIATGVYAGKFAGRLVIEAANIENKIISSIKSKSSLLKKNPAQLSLPLVSRNKKVVSSILKNKSVVKKAGLVVATGIISTGVQEIYESMTGKELSLGESIGANIAGGAAALAVDTGFYKALSGPRGLSGYKHAFRSALKAFKLFK